MALELEVTPGADDANSYLSLAAAQALGAYRVGASGWLEDLDADQQMATLATATAAIDALEPILDGDKSDEDQALEFPRDGDSTIPKKIERATAMLAFSYASAFAEDGSQSDPLAPTRNDVKKEKVGPLETEYFDRATATENTTATSLLATFPAEVQQLLAGFISIPSESSWGSACVVRGS